MKCMDRCGKEIQQDNVQYNILSFLYGNSFGRILLKPLINPRVSKIAGKILSSSFSRVLIPLFIKKYGINLNEYEDRTFASFNDFFTRRIKEGGRVIDGEPGHLIAPCDGKLSVYHIEKDSRFLIKNTSYTLESLLRSANLSHHYENGTLLLFRLTVDDYHRYCYVDDGNKTRNYHIKGVFHTVNPLANEVVPVYKENTREFTILDSENFGKILIMEVGAMLVGKIANYHEEATVKRGEEKGRFEFGGSTIILLFENGRITLDNDILQNSSQGIETRVRMGEKIGIKVNG